MSPKQILAYLGCLFALPVLYAVHYFAVQDKFVISGRVVDGVGWVGLNDVQVRVGLSSSEITGKHTTGESKLVMINENFHFRGSGYQKMGITFSKPGYRTVTLGMNSRDSWTDMTIFMYRDKSRFDVDGHSLEN